MTATAVAKPSKHFQLANGKRIHFRRTQMFGWKGVAAFLGAGFIAGLYFTVLQMHWHLDIGGLHWQGFSLKHWWDNLFHAAWWPVYRHSAFRDIPEPAYATMGVLTLIVKPKYWDKHVSTLRLVTAPLVVILTTFTLGIGGTYLLHYGLPEHIRTLLAHGQIGNILLGVLIGRVLHAFWAPVGAEYQRRLLSRSVVRSAYRSSLPLWVRLPLAPPTLRERFSAMRKSGRLSEDIVLTEQMKTHRNLSYWALTFMVTGFTVITVIGIIAHYWIGKGHTFPYLSS